ncbi:MAG TPA: HAD family hydrolase [Candidatus Norongarragalinales archaeon]|jgi:phosphoglycolate phosphatase-like HAD superfamily hydrolase|nr:HAD family hydrolase [Candidatus Norongarragalinales archaeon]
MTWLIVFDWDGTLYDSFPTKRKLAGEVLHKHLGISQAEAEEHYRQTVGSPMLKIIQKIFTKTKGQPPTKEQAQEILQDYYGQLTERLAKCRLFRDSKPALEKLKANGHKIALLTAAHKEHYDKVLQAENIDQLFDAKVTLEDDSDKSQAIAKLIQEMHTDNKHTVLVGDSTTDIAQGKKAGVHTVGRIGTFLSADLRAAGAENLLSDLERLPFVVQSFDARA